MWEYQYEALRSFRIINPDLFGYGRSESNFDKIFIEQQALDLVLLLDQLNIDKVHLVGLSMGGQIIVEFARLFPHRVRSLVVCASLPNAESPESYQARIDKADQITHQGMKAHTEETISQYINTVLHPPGSLVYQHLFEMMSNTPDQGAVASHRGRAERRDNLAFMSHITVPCLFIAGGKDHFFDTGQIQQVAALVKNSAFVTIDSSGHLPNMEASTEFNGILVSFLNKNISD